MKDPLTLYGIEPGTSRFVAQHLNRCATAVPVGPVNEEILVSKFRLAIDFECLSLHVNSESEPMWEGRQTFEPVRP